ncbi:MAG: hypothetical protein ACYCX4_02700 [Bacillota bacterium]
MQSVNFISFLRTDSACENLLSKIGDIDPFQVADQRGVTVLSYPFKKFEGILAEVDGEKFIGINSRLSKIAQKVIVADGLGLKQELGLLS